MTVDAMSLWQFVAAVEGYNRAHGGEQPIEAPTADEFYDLCYRLGAVAEPHNVQ